MRLQQIAYAEKVTLEKLYYPSQMQGGKDKPVSFLPVTFISGFCNPSQSGINPVFNYHIYTSAMLSQI